MSLKHCIKVDDFSGNELIDLFELTAELKHKYRTKEDFKPFRNHSMAMIFANLPLGRVYHLKQDFHGWVVMQFI